jgi:hypothetical protein
LQRRLTGGAHGKLLDGIARDSQVSLMDGDCLDADTASAPVMLWPNELDITHRLCGVKGCSSRPSPCCEPVSC